MSKLDFKSLASRVRSTDPYRGTMRYPMENRSNRQNVFELVETGDDIEFHVSHGYRYKETQISEARYKMLEGVCGANVNKRTLEHGQCEYYMIDTEPRVLCVVRSDNTLEYVADSYYQGDNMKMSDWMGGYQYDSYKMSGTSYSSGYYNNHNTGLNYPIFKGLRINLETHEPVNQNIQVFRRTVNRKKSKELMSAYKEAFKSPDALLRCMNTETMLVSVKDILDEKTEGENYVSTSEYFKLAEEAFANKENFEAVILYAMSMQIAGFNGWAINNFLAGQTRSYYRMTEPNRVVSALMTSLSKRLYKEHKPFNEEEVAFKNVQGSQWGIRVVVDGVEVNR
jgi:hypothetical protein